MRTSKSGDGFTLVELMIATAILAVLGALCLPAFSSVLYDSMRSTSVNTFVHTIFLARSEAMRRGEIVSICSSANGTTCGKAGADWNTGWIAFVNLDRDEPPVHDDDEPIVFVQGPWQQGRISSNRRAFSFRPHSQGVVNGSVVFCDPRGSATARAVIINRVGRARVSQQDADNHVLRCPGG
jgi:type IV fimbrial biogenesis protein FimT